MQSKREIGAASASLQNIMLCVAQRKLRGVDLELVPAQ
jgi:hypothetical protein